MIRTVRPWRLFAHLTPSQRDVAYHIPERRGTDTETIMALETLLLISAIRIFEISSVLELGTGLGYNAMHLSMNTNAAITTVDKDHKPFIFERFANRQIEARQSDIFDLSPSPQDMVFCDVNYTLDTITAATSLAFKCNPRVVAWHDYGHPLNPHVKPFLDDLAESRDLVHVDDSWIVFWFRDKLEL